MKNIIRKPILFHKNNVALLYIFHRYDHFEDDWIFDIDKLYEEHKDIYESAAKEFFDQMEGTYCKAFLRALIKEANHRLNNFGSRKWT